MREIKFRVWDKKRKRMFAITTLNASGAVSVFIDDGLYLLPAEQIELMQCIGFKDKKGKDIYYGDIIKLDGRHARKGVARIYEVIEDDYYCSATTRTADDDVGYIFFNAEATKNFFTVIGNIYENPELMESENERNN